MTKEIFDEGLKILKRFLKEEGVYNLVFKNYLFRNGRPINDLFKEFNTTKYSDVGRWEVLFNRINLMEGCNKNTFNYDEYSEIIVYRGLMRKWETYYNKAVGSQKRVEN